MMITKQIGDFARYAMKKRLWGRFEAAECKRARAGIRNRDFTLLTSNCIGGVMYHLLGMPFDSPTINLYIKQPEFCRFCSDLEYYLSSELRFFKSDAHQCPCAYLGEDGKEITIQFEHYHTEEEAREKWEERKKRIHWDNLFLILNDGNGLTPEDAKLLDGCKCQRKIIFTSKERPELADSFALHTMRGEKDAVAIQLIRHPLTGFRPWEREFDFVAWLNGEDQLRRK